MAEAQAHQQESIFIEFLHKTKEYVLVIAMVIAAINYLSHYIEEFSHDNPYIKWALYIAVVVTIYSLYFFTVRPVIIKKRELNLRPKGEPDENYFTTAPRNDDRYHFFDSGYSSYLDWLKDIKVPLLYLTGPSGSGKSSLINAYLAPQLENNQSVRTKVHLLRSYHEPLKVLYEALTGKNTGTTVTEEIVFKEIERVAKQLPPGERILIVLDQFEEFFLLRNKPGDSTQKDAETKTIEELKAFFHRFIKNPPGEIYILLSYRDDFQQLIDQLELPARTEHINFEQVKLLSFDQASRFFKNCPGMEVPDMQLKNILKEAASIDTPVALRPIVLNLLGIILKRMISQKALIKKQGALIRQYIVDCLGKELQEERSKMLRAMLTDFNTARPRTVQELSHTTNLSVSQLDNQMIILQHYGLVRCLDTTENSQGKRKWQIAHDFVAVQLEKVVYGTGRVVWKLARPWIAPLMICILAIFVSSYYTGNNGAEKENALRQIEKAGLFWTETTKTISVENLQKLNDSTLRNLLPDFIVLQTETIDIGFTPPELFTGSLEENDIPFNPEEKFSGFSGFNKVKSLKKITVSYNQSLKNLSGLAGLPALAGINLYGCTNLETVGDIERLPKLINLAITGSPKINPEPIQKVSLLKRLYLFDCDSQIVNYIKGLTNLTNLTFGNCTGLKNITGFNKLTGMDSISFNNCKDLQTLKGIEAFTKLTYLELNNCPVLNNLDALTTLSSLKVLKLSECSSSVYNQAKTLKKMLPNLEKVIDPYDSYFPKKTE